MEIVEIIIYSFLSIWGAYITYLLFEIFFDTKEIPTKNKVLMFGAYNLATEIVYLAFNIPMLTLSINMIFFFIIGRIYSKNIKKMIIAIVLITLIVMGGEGLILSIATFENFYIFQDNPLLSTEIIFLGRAVLYILLLTVKQLKSIKSEVEISMKYSLYLIGVSVISIYVIILIISDRGTDIIWRTVGIIGMIIINIGIFYLYNTINEYMNTKIEKVLYQKESIYYQNQSKLFEEITKQDKKMRHDIKNNLLCIQLFLEEGNRLKAKEYIASLENYYKVEKEISKTGVTIIDAILNYKLAKAESKSIYYTLNTSIPEIIDIEDFDIGVVLGNMLDNAFEALELIPENERKLKINIKYSHEALKIEVENTYNGQLHIENNSIKTIKKDEKNHGQGLKIIESIAERHGGYIDKNYNGNTFNIYVILIKNQS